MKTILIVGAGPIGLELALALTAKFESNVRIVIVEQHNAVGGHIVTHWPSTRLFSSWPLNCSSRSSQFAQSGSDERTQCPLASEFCEKFLNPLAAHLTAKCGVTLLLSTRALSIGKRAALKADDSFDSRRSSKFIALVESSSSDGDARERIVEADFVFDASGVLSTLASAGTGGIDGVGERQCRRRSLVDGYVASPETDARFDGSEPRAVAVIGGGFSALTSLRALANSDRVARVYWVFRRSLAGGGGGAMPCHRFDDDPLPERDELSAFGNSVARGEHECIELIDGVTVDEFRGDDDNDDAAHYPLALHLSNARVVKVHLCFANCGYRVDLSLYRELRVHTCYGSEGPMRLAARLLHESQRRRAAEAASSSSSSSSSQQNCLDQSLGADAGALLETTEPNFYVIGAKSFGRNSSFLLRTGIEQVESIVGSMHI
jgi:NAD(P)-binding Rossmann-like domain